MPLALQIGFWQVMELQIILSWTSIEKDLVEWTIASHGMYESALVFISISKQKNLYIVACVQCDIWDLTAYFLLREL